MDFSTVYLLLLGLGGLACLGLGLFAFYEEYAMGGMAGRVCGLLLVGVGFVVLVFLLFGIGVL